MNEYQKEVEKQLLQNEKEVLTELKNNYAKALKDIKQRIKELQGNEITQSKIYQIQYQNNLEKQLQAIVDLLEADNIQTISEYLKTTYEDGFIGTLYNMQTEGVPFIMPINQDEVIKSITKKTGDFQLSKTLYENADKLKKTIKTEITRGISSGMTYSNISQKIAYNSEADLKKAYRIARTEGGRVQSEAKFETMKRAKKNGADIVKQWDSTMDSKTRLTHSMLDGQIKELDEPFEIGGNQAMYPHGFGIASEDINCRCVLLERARWAVENEKGFTKVVDGDIIRFNNIKSYQEFKENYFSFYDNKEENIIGAIIQRINYSKLDDITVNKNAIISKAFNNKEIKKIAFSANIKSIRQGGSESYHIQGRIALKKNYSSKTVMHEVGHAVDWSNGWLSLSKEFKKAIKQDKKLIKRNENLYKNLIKNNRNMIGLSDIIGGMTDNKIVGRYKHKKSYWKRPNTVEKETFAQMFAMAGADDYQQMLVIQQYLPSIFKAFDNIIKGLI